MFAGFVPHRWPLGVGIGTGAVVAALFLARLGVLIIGWHAHSPPIWTSFRNSRLTVKKGTQMESVINDYISREIVQDPAVLPLSNETSLLEGGILDSLSLLRLVVFLEERFGITMGDADLLPENFASVNTICAYLRAQEPAKQKAAHG